MHNPARPGQGRPTRRTKTATTETYIKRSSMTGAFKVYAPVPGEERVLGWTADNPGSVPRLKSGKPVKSALADAKSALAGPSPRKVGSPIAAMPAEVPDFLPSSDPRVERVVNPEAVAGSALLAKARARLAALPPGFTDDLFAAPRFPADVPEILGGD